MSPLADANEAAQRNPSKYGGIDFNANFLDIKVQGNGKPIYIPFDLKVIENVHIDGFLPVILKVTPITNLPLFLGANENKQGSPQLSALR